MSNIKQRIFGYFNDASNTPAFDPGLDIDCPYCGRHLSKPLACISIMADVFSPKYSYFYRCHKLCYIGATEDQIQAVEDPIEWYEHSIDGDIDGLFTDDNGG